MNNNELIKQARKCSICMIGASEDIRESCKIDSCIDVIDSLANALEKTQERANQSALNYQQKCRDIAELEKTQFNTTRCAHCFYYMKPVIARDSGICIYANRNELTEPDYYCSHGKCE